MFMDCLFTLIVISIPAQQTMDIKHLNLEIKRHTQAISPVLTLTGDKDDKLLILHALTLLMYIHRHIIGDLCLYHSLGLHVSFCRSFIWSYLYLIRFMYYWHVPVLKPALSKLAV